MSTSPGAVLSRLASIVGASHVTEDASSVQAYSIDGVAPVSAVRPGSIAEAAEVVKFAAAERLALVASGARTKLAMGLPPREYDLALDLSRLDRISAYDPGDLTLSVEAGIPLSKIASALAQHAQFLPLAVPFENSATIGGTIASGIDSPLRQFFGTARDFVLGMEFITGDGSLAKSGGRVVKNVTGYDLHKLMIGAMGSLGVIAQVHFRTFPAPRSRRAFLASFDRSKQAWTLRQSIADSPLRPLTLDILSPGVAQLFGSNSAAKRAPEPYNPKMLADRRWTLTSGFAGNAKALDRYAADLRRMAEHAGAAEIATFGEEGIPGAFGRKREFIPIALEASPATVVLKVSALPSRMNQVLSAAEKAAASRGIDWAAIIRGVGVAYAALLPKDRGAESLKAVLAATDEILAATAAAVGNATIPWCPAEWKSRLKIWGLDRAEFAQMKKLKAFFDPAGVFSPGRFMGGI
ncbi:MAG TPA: FAD-binding oxidoreductase [Verrucomicrobiae bacterium]|nr:FAD-binding oxidoreductase [Verrucomicrobiae bacterium]